MKQTCCTQQLFESDITTKNALYGPHIEPSCATVLPPWVHYILLWHIQQGTNDSPELLWNVKKTLSADLFPASGSQVLPQPINLWSTCNCLFMSTIMKSPLLVTKQSWKILESCSHVVYIAIYRNHPEYQAAGWPEESYRKENRVLLHTKKLYYLIVPSCHSIYNYLVAFFRK
jgi:hypothetical protein